MTQIKLEWVAQFHILFLWNALRSGGLFISDDIGDNLFFAEFVDPSTLHFALLR